MSKENLHTFSIRIPVELNSQLEIIAAKEKRSKNNMVELLLSRALYDWARSNSEGRTPELFQK